MSAVDQFRSRKWHTFDYHKSRLAGIERRGGVYVVYCGGKLVYIGQSSDVNKRIWSYRFRAPWSENIFTPWGQFKSVIIKVSYGSQFGDWAMRELRLIRWLRPPFNCVGSVKLRANARQQEVVCGR
jgi:hypothetical protein